MERYHKNTNKQAVILCDRGISPRLVKPLLTGDNILYEGGVEVFGSDYQPKNSESTAADLDKQKEDLERWLDQGGTFLTHERMFRGCESEAVILLSENWSQYHPQRRDALTRAVSDLCIVSDNKGIDYEMARRYFDVRRQVDKDKFEVRLIRPLRDEKLRDR